VVVVKPDLSKKFERSLLGEVVISAVAATALLVAVVWNLPDSEIRRSAIPTLAPIAESTGLEQVWSMYAPDPIRRNEDLEVRVTMADGTDRVWTFDRSEHGGGPLFWNRWQKLKEQVVRIERLRPGLASWVIGELTTPEEHPARVQILMRATDLAVPGQHSPPAAIVETLYDRELSGAT
jgi:hypothetical protein